MHAKYKKIVDMAGLRSNVDHIRSEIKLKIEEAKDKWEEYVKRI